MCVQPKSGVSDEKLGVSNKIIDLVKKLFEILLFVAGEFGMVAGDTLIICRQIAPHTLLHSTVIASSSVVRLPPILCSILR